MPVHFFSKVFPKLAIQICLVILLCLGYNPKSIQASPVFFAGMGITSPIPLLSTTASPVYFENRFTVSKNQLTDFLERWDSIGYYIKQKAGFISAELKKDVSGNDWKMSEEWESLDAYKKAVSTPEFQSLIQDFPGKASWFARDLFPTQP